MCSKTPTGSSGFVNFQSFVYSGMKRTVTLPLVLFVFLFAACGHHEPPESTAAPTPAPRSTMAADSASTQEQAQELDHEEDQANLGQKISTITFRTKATKKERKNYDDGIVSWINLDSPEIRITNLIDADAIVIPYEKVKLRIDYPIAKPVFFYLSGAERGFTRKQIILAISKKYHQMYDEEEKTAKIKTIAMKDRKTLANRNKTDGKYGIWGHDLSDLDLDSINVYQSADGTIILDLDIES
jgi:hypothetical protein